MNKDDGAIKVFARKLANGTCHFGQFSQILSKNQEISFKGTIQTQVDQYIQQSLEPAETRIANNSNSSIIKSDFAAI
jgi:hypothetical protein